MTTKYSDGEVLMLTYIRSLNEFDRYNTSRCDWLVLNSGKSDHYVVLRPGEFTTEWIGMSTYQITYTTVIEMWQSYTTEAVSYENLYTQLLDPLMGLMAYPRMGDTSNLVLDSTILYSSEPQFRWTASGNVQWLYWELYVNWKETHTVTIS